MERLAARAEEASLNAWPALKEIFYDGWLIRLAGGETRRTNSVNVVGPSCRGFAEKLAHCEAVYRAHGLPCYFRICSNGDPALDAALAKAGYEREDESLTLYRHLARTPPRFADPEVSLRPLPPDRDWLDAHARFTGRTAAQSAMRARLIDLIALPVAFAALRDAQGAIVSLAYGALHDGLMSLQWVATDPAHRRQGLSQRVIETLLCWARDAGADGACLQVAADNTPALALYRRLSFDRELYRYHYQVRG